VSETKPYKAIAFVKTSLVMLDQPALSAIDKAEPHPFMIRDILERSQVYHATVFPLRYIDIPGQKLYDAIRRVIFDSFRDPSLDGEIFQTFKWLAYEKWDSQKRSLPDFQCPHCDSAHATLPFDADTGMCQACGKDLLVTDMLGFHQVMGGRQDLETTVEFVPRPRQQGLSLAGSLAPAFSGENGSVLHRHGHPAAKKPRGHAHRGQRFFFWLTLVM